MPRPPAPPPRITLQTAVVLFALANGHRWGFEIIDATGLGAGTVYPILRRLEQSGLVSSRWEKEATAHADLRPPRRYYQVTGAGRVILATALERFPGVAGLVARTPPATEGA